MDGQHERVSPEFCPFRVRKKAFISDQRSNHLWPPLFFQSHKTFFRLFLLLPSHNRLITYSRHFFFCVSGNGRSRLCDTSHAFPHCQFKYMTLKLPNKTFVSYCSPWTDPFIRLLSHDYTFTSVYTFSVSLNGNGWRRLLDTSPTSAWLLFWS